MRVRLVVGLCLAITFVFLFFLTASAGTSSTQPHNKPTRTTLSQRADNPPHRLTPPPPTTTTTQVVRPTISGPTWLPAPPTTTVPTIPPEQTGNIRDLILVCIRSYEGEYTSVNPSGKYKGAYQFDSPTWAWAVTGAGHAHYANTPANQVPPEIQDAAAWWVYQGEGITASRWPTPHRYCQPPAPIPKWAR